MKVLVVGSGGREHAICWALRKSPEISFLFCAPGNGGIGALAECVDIKTDDIKALVDFARKEAIDLVVIGPEVPLVFGLVDELNDAGILAFGPTAQAARLEGSKAFAKAFCERYNIPTANFARFSRADRTAALDHVDRSQPPYVVKADGLAAGKGVIIAHDGSSAKDAICMMLDDEFGTAATNGILIEDYLEGPEISLFAISDGRTVIEFGTAQDHKRAFDDDKGPNTGGMGAFSPASQLDETTKARIMSEIIGPTISGMAEDGDPFRGILYAGVIITNEGPKLLEYNVRFGDPECQAVLLRLKSDLASILVLCARGDLASAKVEWVSDAAITIVVASHGYPGEYAKGSMIGGIDALEGISGITCFHAGTTYRQGRYLANGGRVLNVTATGSDLAEARARAYHALRLIDWPEGFYRTDIGLKALSRPMDLGA